MKCRQKRLLTLFIRGGLFVLPIYVASLSSVSRNDSGYPPYPTVTELCQSQASRFACSQLGSSGRPFTPDLSPSQHLMLIRRWFA